MRTLATLGTLLLGLAFVFWALPAKADCPHQLKTDHPHCDGAEPSGATLGDLACNTDEIARFDGTQWVCDVDRNTLGDLGTTLGDLACNTDEIATFNGAQQWVCDDVIRRETHAPGFSPLPQRLRVLENI